MEDEPVVTGMAGVVTKLTEGLTPEVFFGVITDLMPLEQTIKEARIIENLHTLIKNNGQNFELTEQQQELANLLI